MRQHFVEHAARLKNHEGKRHTELYFLSYLVSFVFEVCRFIHNPMLLAEVNSFVIVLFTLDRGL